MRIHTAKSPLAIVAVFQFPIYPFRGVNFNCRFNFSGIFEVLALLKSAIANVNISENAMPKRTIALPVTM